eukprot:12330752-Heterocapsa_arctica.AAC.1
MALTLAQTYADEFMAARAPFQYALSARAGTDCVSHALRSAPDNAWGPQSACVFYICSGVRSGHNT